MTDRLGIGIGPDFTIEPAAGIFTDLSKEQMLKELNDNFLPTDDVLMEQNALVINTGERIILFDTGVGTAKAFRCRPRFYRMPSARRPQRPAIP